MKTCFLLFCLGTLVLMLLSSFGKNPVNIIGDEMLAFGSSDTLIIENTSLGSGSKIMTDQDGLVIIVPSGNELSRIEIYYSSISTLNSDSSRLLVKTQRSWSCAPLGNANPFSSDQYTLAFSKNTKVQVGWNKYEFENPIPITSDTIFIWPDLIQQINPRVVYAQGNTPEIRSMTGTSCANPNASTSSLDYACKLSFISKPVCPSFLFINHSDSTCYYADSILSKASIGMNKTITYFSKNQVLLDTTFEVLEQASLVIDMDGCK